MVGKRTLPLMATSSNKRVHPSSSQKTSPQQHGRSTGSKFTQPAFSSSPFVSKRHSPPTQDKDDSSNTSVRKINKSKNKYGGDSSISSRHKERLQTAGREGTKRYQNPNKVCLGNLAFNITSKDLENWLSEQFSVPAPLLLKQCKVIHNWQTLESKGYGFAVFSEPIYATVCLEKCDGLTLRGRKIKVSPGFKKMPDPRIYLEKKLQKAKDREEAAIQQGIMDASSPSTPKQQTMDPIEAQMLRRLDPDLVGDVNTEVDSSIEIDADYDDEHADDDFLDEEMLEDDMDGFWVDDEDESSGDRDGAMPDDGSDCLPMNRQRRREAARKKKKRSVSEKGFG